MDAKKLSEKLKKPVPKPKFVMKPRLPHGSRFDLVYDAADTHWSGTLTIPGVPKPFFWKIGSVIKLFKKLDDKYREWLDNEEHSKYTFPLSTKSL